MGCLRLKLMIKIHRLYDMCCSLRCGRGMLRCLCQISESSGPQCGIAVERAQLPGARASHLFTFHDTSIKDRQIHIHPQDCCNVPLHAQTHTLKPSTTRRDLFFNRQCLDVFTLETGPCYCDGKRRVIFERRQGVVVMMRTRSFAAVILAVSLLEVS